ncbi:putative membrane protein [Desulfosporosinus acidiphilus SJ4]|uniref:Putative membrane protein n=1 Tax=Desulfosporosinus acidiphilus (strain DSM 22704 / JCM 16185 / SJ4) TaxID=646529 RepID=I4D0Y9_DESAJ|nr:putative sulfate exporter family transporter [Desulfosporosinus acidiphilus]AFM39463.1 putative membrane protein [Desulfosporosinus acidiphilus SJ4]
MSTNMSTQTKPSGGLGDLFKKEDYWAVWLGLGIVVVALLLWISGNKFMSSIAVNFPGNWTDFSKITAFISANLTNLFLLWLVFTVIFTVAVKTLGHKVGEFILGFTLLFIASIVIYILGASKFSNHYNLESPLWALVIGMIIANLFRLPEWFNTSLRTEFYVKTGIVLLGATLPFTMIVQAGPAAFLQATVIAVSTYLTIYFIGTRVLKLDHRFAATLAAGGSICGVSASIAIGSSVKSEKQHVSVAISLVVVWAIVMVIALPFVIKALGIPDGPGGAWIGTSEFADAAGMAAAAAISEQAIRTFTLMKVVGRDMWIGIWCFIMALISVTKWEKDENGAKPQAGEIWARFPKFVIGFFIASILLTIIVASSAPASAASVTANVIGPIKVLRSWTFIFTFLCIGLTTRFRDLTSVGWKPFAAFTAGVCVNVPLGFIFSTIILGGFWQAVK